MRYKSEISKEFATGNSMTTYSTSPHLMLAISVGELLRVIPFTARASSR